LSLTFLNVNPSDALAQIKARFEEASGRVLYPAQIENLLLHVLAYRESLLRHDIQRCAEQGLASYAIGQHLDEMGALVGCQRLQPAAAECKIQFTLDEPAPLGRSFAPGTRIMTGDGKVAFETIAVAYAIKGRDESNEVLARSLELGTGGNGLGVGVLCELYPKIAGVSATNTTPTEGGGDLEGDEAYRGRIFLAAARYGGGSAKGYRQLALSASALVSDALVLSGEDGNIFIYLLTADGAPSQELLKKVQDFCNKDNARLINDYVLTFAAVERPYVIRAAITVYAGHDAEIVLDKVRALAHGFAQKQALRLGRDVTPTQILMALWPEKDGLYHVELTEPSEILEIGPNEWAHAAEIEITLAGVANG
jgi:phage-related baseplate assembly protein